MPKRKYEVLGLLKYEFQWNKLSPYQNNDIGQVRLVEFFAGIFCMQIIPPKTEYFAKHSSVKWNYLLQIIPFWVE